MIDAAEMEHLKTLARLHLSDDETEAMRGDLNRILGYFEQLQALDTTGVEEMQRPVDLVNILRADEPGETFSQAVALSLAHDTHDGFILVPRTVEQ
ncbi:Asp-tRNA(Asn)/Glu-tRNA(Gln) amidotransferase subunit GatC [Deinococcus maricopensis]|uniref:Aspartyl/glutamyl-tRNA(Asn/Gln) amidotransferase subunit C n=1 Tax=Deinococcus maricopensis (strain DSM 21211 / LMG 22137 / NRRL B-23946 / LB-34) TaxID=709986 RepID=E8UAR8_DEIML|nr:Asp-tRNA(Asn)/Glu-tRNA(Gln) amidotransferase subunit GatC [Deinococcus maricopensis]ADV68157.1 Aspartyl/glutamyl-tRNA(Asn/Gln) amidotransferase subunit C [Deinococcus maricopensis DSM 21211]